jgi:DnaK suppressor protein
MTGHKKMLDKKVLEELKEALLKEEESLEKSLGKIAMPLDKKIGDYETSFEDIGSDMEDNTTEVEQYTSDLPVEISLENKLQDILAALEEMEKGTYGICQNCHEEIDLERLRINPSARTCIKCKK